MTQMTDVLTLQLESPLYMYTELICVFFAIYYVTVTNYEEGFIYLRGLQRDMCGVKGISVHGVGRPEGGPLIWALNDLSTFVAN